MDAHPRPHPRRALLVEDNALLRRMLADALAGHGFEVLEAGTVQEGLQLLGAHLAGLDVVVTDVTLPDMRGERLVEALHAAGGGPAVVVVSGRSWEELAPVPSLDAFFDKGLGPARVASAIAELVSRRAQGVG
jgi:DNA-binding response OmpR family regulator